MHDWNVTRERLLERSRALESFGAPDLAADIRQAIELADSAAELKTLVASLSERVAAQSALLSRRAEKEDADGR